MAGIEQWTLAPEIFVDAFGEISLKHGMIRIELVSLSGSEPRVTQRLIMNLQAFSQMLQAQNGMLEQLQKAGMIRPVEPPPAAEAGTRARRRGRGSARGWCLHSVPRPSPQAIRGR